MSERSERIISTASEPIVSMRGVTKHFRVHGAGRRHLTAVADVDLDVQRGEVLGVVGESGSGKTTLGRCLLGLTEPTAGVITVEGSAVSAGDIRLRRTIQPVFQDSFGSLDPRWSVRRSVREALDALEIGTTAERDRRVDALLAEVGLRPEIADRRPGTLSGGQRQRVGIAAALAPQPRLLVADEPVSALDVSVQAQILNLFASLRRDHGLTIVFITHDLSVVEHLADRVAVMYLGRIVELGTTAQLFSAPAHPYTKALLSAAPRPDPARRLIPRPVYGEVPSPIDPPSGCPFHPRCIDAFARCPVERPATVEVAAGHLAACHLVDPDIGQPGPATTGTPLTA